jgi:hypothetical protein
MSVRAGIVCAAIVAALAGGYLEFVRDIRTPRAELVVAGVVGINQQLSTERFIAIQTAMKAKYGDQAQTWIGPNGTTTKVNGQVVATEKLEGRFYDTIGLTLVGGTGDAPFGLFPFEIGPSAVPQQIPASALALMIRDRFKSIIRSDAMDFTDRDFGIEDCRNLSASELGLKIAGPLLRLGQTTLCTVVWRKTKPSRMLIGITAANGGFWIRPFERSVCRTLAKAWLHNTSQSSHAQRPDFVQCMIADRPASKSNAVATRVYQVRPDGTLALAPESASIVPL